MTNLICCVVAALIQIESAGKADAVGDGGKAVGILQMWPIAVREANRVSGGNWTLADRLDPEKSKAMAFATLVWHYKRGVINPVALAGRWRNPRGNAPTWYLNKARKALAENKTKILVDGFQGVE